MLVKNSFLGKTEKSYYIDTYFEYFESDLESEIISKTQSHTYFTDSELMN